MRKILDMRFVFDHQLEEPCVLVEFESGSKMFYLNGTQVAVGSELTDIKPNQKDSFNYFDAGDDYNSIRELLDSPIIERSSATPFEKHQSNYPGSRFTIKLKGMNTEIMCKYTANEVGEPFYLMKGKVPLKVLRFLEHMNQKIK